jgi:hypothetical protein
MKDFKKLIKEAHLGNPLNENKYDDEDIVIYDGEEYIIMRKDGNMVYIRPLEDSAILGKKDEIKVPARALAYKSDLDKMYDEYKPKDEINEVDEKWDKIARDEYGKPWMELSIAQKQELLSYMNRDTEKQFQTDYERRRRGDYSDDMEDGMTDYQRRRMDEEFKKGDKVTYLGNPAEITFVGKDQMDRTYYSVSYDKGNGKTKASNLYNKDGEIKAINETDINDPVLMKKQDLKEFGSSDKNALLSSMHINLGYPKEFPGLSKIMDAAGDATDFYMDDFEEYSTNRDELVMSNARAYARREFPDFMAQAAKFIEPVDEAIDANDPVLMRTRAAQMKRDAMDKKDLENKSKRISADKAIDLRYELSILNKEREDILMRIEDIAVEMDQTAEPEGGPIADKLGERLMAAQRELRAIDSKIIDIKDDLGVFDMNESINENTLGDLVKKYGKDLINFVIDIDELTKEEIKDVEYLDDRIQIHLEEPEIRQKYLPEGTCGYGEDGVIGDKPAGPDLNEDEIPSYLTKNIIFGKAVEDSVSFNDFQKRVYGILGPKYYKLIDQGALKDFYDSVRVTKPSMEEAFDLDIDDAHSGDTALDRTVGKMGYNESLKKSLKESLNKRLGK